MTRKAAALVLSACAAAGIAGGLILHGLARPAQTSAALKLPELHGQAVWAPGRRPAPAFALRDQTGRLLKPTSFRGRTVVLTFLDSHCTTRCPLVGRELAMIVQRLPRADRPVLLVVSVNPNDTPRSARAAVSRWGIPSGWHWLMADRTRLAQVWRAYGITVIPTTHDINHSLAVYLLDRHGNERTGYLFPFQPPFVEGDLRALARERL